MLGHFLPFIRPHKISLVLTILVICDCGRMLMQGKKTSPLYKAAMAGGQHCPQKWVLPKSNELTRKTIHLLSIFLLNDIWLWRTTLASEMGVGHVQWTHQEKYILFSQWNLDANCNFPLQCNALNHNRSRQQVLNMWVEQNTLQLQIFFLFWELMRHTNRLFHLQFNF